MTVLAPALAHARLVWEQELAYARGTGGPSEEVAQRRATVLIDYEGALPDLRSAGVEPGFDAGGRITGIVAFADLERLDAVDGVTQVSLQPTVTPTLDGTVKEMKVPWQNPSGGGFQGRGRGVIVAVIDTGIDIFHESFINADGTSRILELWDHTAGLAGGSNPPAGFTQIGKVYSQQQITAAIAAGPPFASRDTNGHGTHVAGTSAGSGRQDDRCSFPGHYVGVAPEADLVIAKVIGVTERRHRLGPQLVRPGRRPQPRQQAGRHQLQLRACHRAARRDRPDGRVVRRRAAAGRRRAGRVWRSSGRRQRPRARTSTRAAPSSRPRR